LLPVLGKAGKHMEIPDVKVMLNHLKLQLWPWKHQKTRGNWASCDFAQGKQMAKWWILYCRNGDFLASNFKWRLETIGAFSMILNISSTKNCGTLACHFFLTKTCVSSSFRSF
jgi:hypothetical protein